jgi:hypothetical protein
MIQCKFTNKSSLSIDLTKSLLKRAENKTELSEFKSEEFSKQSIIVSTRCLDLKENLNLIAWHYTTGRCFMAIAKSVFLRPTKPKFSYDEIPILMFSKKNDWEPIFRRAVSDESGQRDSISKAETASVGGGLFRFGYPVERLMPSNKLLKLAQVPYRTIKCLERIGFSLGVKSSDWLGTFDAISIDQLVIEFSDGKQWVRIQNGTQSMFSLNETITSKVS